MSAPPPPSSRPLANPASATGTTGPQEQPPRVEPAELAEVRRTGVNPLPVRALQIETSSICNFRCASCALSDGAYDRPEQHMDPETFRRVLDAFPTAEKVELQGVGEVFLNPRVFELIRAATERGVRVDTFSNASKITRAVARGIVESGVHTINLSMDGADEPTFRKLRKGGTLARYRRCVTNLVQARAALGSTTPRIGIMSVLSRENQHQVGHMLAIAESLGVDTIIFTKLIDGPKPDQKPLMLDASERERLLALPQYRGRVEPVWAITPWTKEQRMDCYWPKGMTYVTIEGDVTPCCNYFDSREVKLGNVLEQDGAAIWNGAPYREFRRRLLSGDVPPKCWTC